MSSPDLSGWLLTYAVHSTVLLLLAWILASRVKSHRIRETLWKTALFGGFLTATGQSLLSVRPLGGRMTVAAVQPAPAGVSEGPRAGIVSNEIESDAAGLADPSAAGSGLTSDSPPPVGLRFSALTLILMAWGAGAALLLARYLVLRLRFARRIAARRPVTEGPVAEMLAELCAEAGVIRPVVLSASRALPSPVALGGREIAVPEAALTDLEPGQQRSMLAHELAHLERGDPRWLTAACLAECVGFVQPLNRLARKRMQESAEYLCDEWAVRRTGSGVLLAKCLAKVAEWLESAPRTVPLAGMAEDRSHLVARVRRLLDGHPFPKAPARKTLHIVSGAILALTILAIPGVSLARHSAEPLQGSSSASESDPVSEPDGKPRQTVADTGKEIVTALMGVARDANVEVRRAAIRSLGRHQDRTAIPVLREALRDSDAEVRTSAIDGLSEMEDAGSADAIAALIRDPNKEVRSHAIDALTNLELSSPPAGLRDALRDPDPEVRHRAAHAIGHFEDPAAVPALRAMLDDGNAEVREAAVEALASIRNEPAIQALIVALKSKDARVRQAAADALGKRN
jgi:beta-lactamase regulating signal transducer with metallopeptidase domain